MLQMDPHEIGDGSPTLECVASRFVDARPGYELVAFEPVGLPFFRIELDGSFLEVRDLSTIEEFVLRSVSAGLTDVNDISDFLGLSLDRLQQIMADLARSDELTLHATHGTVRQQLMLTEKGRLTCELCERQIPVDMKFSVVFDGLAWRPVRQPLGRLYSPTELKSVRVRELPSFPARSPTLDDLQLPAVRAISDSLKHGRQLRIRSLLSINRLVRRYRLYLPAVALLFRSKTSEALQVSFAVDGALSDEHETRFARHKGPEKTGLLRNACLAPDLSRLEAFVGKAVLHKAVPVSEVRRLRILRREAERRLGLVATDDANVDCRREAAAALLDAHGLLRQQSIYFIDSVEHPVVLLSALQRATHRLLIVTERILASVGSATVLEMIVAALNRGVQVLIGYSLDDGETATEDQLSQLAHLERLAKGSKLLTVKPVPRSVPNILAVDSEYVVVSTWAWLGETSNPKTPFREHRGVHISEVSARDEILGRAVEVFNKP